MATTYVETIKSRNHGDERVEFEALIAGARIVAGLANARAPETERNRMVSGELVEAMWEHRLLDVLKPVRFGGQGLTMMEFNTLVYEIARGDASTAWVFSVLAGHASNIADFSAEAQEEVWGGNGKALVSSAFAPTGKVDLISGGYRISGKFPFSSGCDHASWVIVGGMAPTATGEMRPLIFLIPKTEMSIHDDWQTMGLRGTGSKTLACADVLVPEHRAMPIPAFEGSIAAFGLQSVMVGAATGGIESFVRETKDKPAKYGSVAPSESDHVQTLIGESWADATTAWLALNHAVKTTLDYMGQSGGQISPDLALANRAANSVLSRLTVSAVERVYGLSGGSGVYDSHLSRCFRDVRAGSQHMATNTNIAGRAVGLALLKQA